VTFQIRVPARVALAARRFAADSSGTTAIEYALLGVLIAVAIVAAVNQVGDGVRPMFEQLAGKFGN
jgi:pilus assembly protein Flp/PilA